MVKNDITSLMILAIKIVFLENVRSDLKNIDWIKIKQEIDLNDKRKPIKQRIV